MMRRNTIIYVIITLLGGAFSMSCTNNDDPNIPEEPYQYDKSEEILTFANQQLKYAIHYSDSVTNQQPELVSPIGIEPQSNTFVMGKSSSWRCGFFPGELWMMYEYTRDDYWKEEAEKHSWAIQFSCHETGHHDFGFMFNNSFGRAYRTTKDKKWLEILLSAGKALASRYNPVVGCTRSWGKVDDMEGFVVIIDNMMNLELLYEMTKITGDSTYYNMACSHARKTMKNHFRSDYSSYHVLNYDPANGKVIWKRTSQGYSDESYWSRGQSWGLYGFTMCYRYSKDASFLQHAKHIANFLMGLNYADDLIPYWDMLSPDIPNTVRDASAGTIMASALIELSYYCDGDEKEKYLSYAIKLLDNLHKDYESKIGENYGFLLLHSTQNYHIPEMLDSSVVYADYYYMEAVLRLFHYRNLEEYLENS